MIVKTKNVLLFIEPKNNKSEEPINDEYTNFIEKLLDNAMNDKSKMGVVTPKSFVKGMRTLGVHTCCCKECSHSCDYEIYDGFYTNSLATHYLRWHRNEVPQEELDKIMLLMNLYYKNNEY